MIRKGKGQHEQGAYNKKHGNTNAVQGMKHRAARTRYTEQKIRTNINVSGSACKSVSFHIALF